MMMMVVIVVMMMLVVRMRISFRVGFRIGATVHGEAGRADPRPLDTFSAETDVPERKTPQSLS
jgi:hypothetical protein